MYLSLGSALFESHNFDLVAGLDHTSFNETSSDL